MIGDTAQSEMAMIGTSLTGVGISIAAVLDAIPNQIPAAIIGTTSFIVMWVMIWKTVTRTRRANALADIEIEKKRADIVRDDEACKVCPVMNKEKE